MLLTTSCASLCVLLLTTTPSVPEIIKKMDANMTFDTRVADAQMRVTTRNETNTRTLKVWARGQVDTYVEFLAPARDKGIKYLKLNDNLYMFLPSTEKVMKISGHLLRQSLMDSDFSYEDMLEARALIEDYDGKVVGEEKIGDEMAWILDMRAKRSGVTYARRKVWVGKKTYVPLKEQRFAKSGTLLKEMFSLDIEVHGDRHYPTRMVMQDKLKKGSETTFKMTRVTFGVSIPKSTFSRRNLMRRR